MLSLFIALLLYPSVDVPATADTRAAEIERQRQEKAKHVKPDDPPKAERAFIAVQNNPLYRALMSNPTGFRLRFGGLVSGSGFALGPEYYRPDLRNGNIVFRIGASASLRKYELLDAQLAFPHLASDRVYFDIGTAYRNYPSISYYGPGPNSLKTGRTDYRFEDTSFDFTAAVKPARRVKIGITGGYLLVNVGPGTDDRFASTDTVYAPAITPGIERQSNFMRYGPMLQIDYRDRPGDPHSGGNYVVKYLYYDDRVLNTADFRKVEAEVQQYIPFFNEKRVIALRGRTELSYPQRNDFVPFYLQPTLGGGDDLRGFRPFRFYDNNSIVLNGEYRWEVMYGFEMALFADAGKVFHNPSQLDLTGLERDFGFGLRFTSGSNVVMRIDTGFSREGFQVWIKFGNVF